MGCTRVLGRIMGMTGGMTGLLALHDVMLVNTIHNEEFYSLYVISVLALSCLIYYVLCKLLQLAMRPTVVIVRPSMASQYLNIRPAASTELVMGLPKLTIENVWILVYGLGTVYFVTGYSMLGLEPTSLACVGLSMGVLCMDELAYPRLEMSKAYLSLRVAVLLTVFAGLVLVCSDMILYVISRYFTSMDPSQLFFGVGMPFLSQFLMLLVRDHRKYTLGSVLEVCEFGFPFTVILSVAILGAAEGQRQVTSTYAQVYNATMSWYLNVTSREQADSVGSVLAFYGLAPVLVAPAIIIYTECILDGNAIDALLSVSMALSIGHCTRVSSSTLSVYALICNSVAIIGRAIGEYHPMLGNSFMQEPSTQLSERAIREKARTDLERISEEPMDGYGQEDEQHALV